MKKTTLMVMIITIIAKLAGFLRERVFIHYFGASAITDAFMMAFNVPTTIIAVFLVALVTGFIPMYTKVKNDFPEKENQFASNTFNLLVLFSFLVGLVMFLLPGLFVKVSAVGFSEETYQLATSFLRIISFSVVSVSIVQLGTGYLNVKESFLIPAFVSIPSNAIVIIATILAHKTQMVSYLSMGSFIGFLTQAIIIYGFMLKKGYRHEFLVDLKDEHLQEMIRLSIPLLISTFILMIDDTVMKSYSTLIYGEGAYSYISMALRLMGFATGLFVSGVLDVAYPTIAQAAFNKDKVKVIHAMNDAILMISLFIFPTLVGFQTLSYEIVAFVYMTGKFGPEEVLILSQVFRMLTLSLVTFGFKDLFTRIHYAFHDMKTPFKNQFYYAIVDIVLLVILGQVMGLPGITLAAALAGLFSTIYLLNSLLNKFGRLGMIAVASDVSKILISSVIMGAVILLSKGWISKVFSPRMSLIVVVIIAVITYGISVLSLKVQVLLSLLK